MKLFKLKPGQHQVLLDWGKQLSTIYKDEVLETLKEENCQREYFYVFQIGENWYAIADMEPLDNLNIMPATDRELNTKHKQILDQCIEASMEILPAYDLKLK